MNIICDRVVCSFISVTNYIQSTPTPSLRFRRSHQSKPAKHPVDIGYSTYIPQRLRSLHNRSYLLYIPERQHHRTPRKALAAFSSVYP